MEEENQCYKFHLLILIKPVGGSNFRNAMINELPTPAHEGSLVNDSISDVKTPLLAH